MLTIHRKPVALENYSRQETQKVGVVFHWIVGEQTASDATFLNPSRKASAHYSIGSNGEIHQYVDEKHIAWHAGNSTANRKYIGIEHAGGQLLPDGTRKKSTKACEDSSVELVTDICKRWNIKPERRITMWKHKEVSDKVTECCGLLDVDRIVGAVANNLYITDQKVGSKDYTDAELNEAMQWNDLLEEKKYLRDGKKLMNLIEDEEDKIYLVNLWRMTKLTQDTKFKNNWRAEHYIRDLADYFEASLAV